MATFTLSVPVIGWTQGGTFTGIESSLPYMREVGYIKGANDANAGAITFSVTSTPGTSHSCTLTSFCNHCVWHSICILLSIIEFNCSLQCCRSPGYATCCFVISLLLL